MINLRFLNPAVWSCRSGDSRIMQNSIPALAKLSMMFLEPSRVHLSSWNSTLPNVFQFVLEVMYYGFLWIAKICQVRTMEAAKGFWNGRARRQAQNTETVRLYICEVKWGVSVDLVVKITQSQFCSSLCMLLMHVAYACPSIFYTWPSTKLLDEYSLHWGSSFLHVPCRSNCQKVASTTNIHLLSNSSSLSVKPLSSNF